MRTFLNAKPRTAIFLCVIVLNSEVTTRWLKRLFWYLCARWSTCACAGDEADGLVHDGNLTPVVGDFRKVKRLGQVDEVEDVLLEAGACP